MSYCPLDLVENYLKRFVAYPSDHALVAHTLWIAHTHLIENFDTTPRLAFMSAEKESGKTRALEVTALFVPAPIASFSASPAVIIRLVAQGGRTVLYDEVDALFGSARREDGSADLVAFLNSGYRRGAKAYRCAGGNGRKIEAEEFDSFAPVALAGLRSLPDTLASRSIFIRMKRKAPGEKVEAFRYKYHPDEAKPIKERLVEWCEDASTRLNDPAMPVGVVDRAADIWEPLIAIADAAGGDWPALSRSAALHFTRRNTEEEAVTAGVELLSHIRDAFVVEEKLWTKALIDSLCERDESPWKDIRGKPLDDRGLANRLRPYGIKSKDVWIAGTTKKGYLAADFHEDWKRYLSAPEGDEGDEGEEIDNKDKNLADLADLAVSREERVVEYLLPKPRGDGDGFYRFKDPRHGLQPRRTGT